MRITEYELLHRMSDDDDEETFDDVTEVHRFFRPLVKYLFNSSDVAL